MAEATTYGEYPAWTPETPKFKPVRLIVNWVTAGVGVLVTAWILPGISVEGFAGALAVAVAIGVLNAVVPPLVAALRLPVMAALGFILILLIDAAIIYASSELTDNAIEVDSYWIALLAALVISAVTMILEIIFGTNDDDDYDLRVTRRVARRQGVLEQTDVPGIIFLEIDGLGYPVLQRAMRDGSAPELSKWIDDGTHRLVEWETDLSSQTGASQAGILLGSNKDIPAFRWVEKGEGRLLAVSGPDEVVEVEARLSTGIGLLRDGGASRGNIFSGEAEATILTVARLKGDIKANPGYRGFFANGYNVTSTLVLIVWEIFLELSAAGRQRRRNIVPRGHRGGIYPLLRAVMCVFVRDLIVSGILQDMMRGRPVMYATFSSYDEVAHHSGLERPDTLEALRKVDQQFGRIARARRYAPRPYEIVVLSDHGQTQGATFKQRNGYGFDELVNRNVTNAEVGAVLGGDEHDSTVGQAFAEATGTSAEEKPKKKDRKAKKELGEVVVLGSGNLGLIYLMEEKRRLTLEEIDERHPKLIPALREHPHVGWLLVRSSEHGAVALGANGANYLDEGRVEGEDPLAILPPNAARHLKRTDSFSNVGDIMVGSFYDPMRDEGCAFEELISFHGGLGGPQTRGFILHPVTLPVPADEIIGAEEVHHVLDAWRWHLQGGEPKPATPA
jgi:uncharacterized membrane protein YvlD (DUF360 family)